jgi:5'-3' exonuclease
MISVICDGNYLFHKTFGVFSGFGSSNPGEILSKKADRNIFMRKVMTDLCYSLNHIPIDGHVVFVKDSRSWRKDLVVERGVYKGSRKDKLDKKVDWGSFYDLIEEFGEFLQLNGYIYSKAGGAEGDDLLWFWNKKLNELGSNVVIYSGDKDSHQLVSARPNQWTICWNANSKNNKVVAANGWTDNYLNAEEELSVFDVSFDTDSEKDKIRKLLASSTLEEIDPEKLLFEKILTGDIKDDVPPVWAYEKTPDKLFKLTAGKATDIYNHFKASGWGDKGLKEIWTLDEYRQWVSGFILRSMSSADSQENRSLAIKHYEENAKLVWLSDAVIPAPVIENMEMNYEKKKMEPKQILFDRKTMIARSPWNEDLAPSNFDPFHYKK